jgi:hypothetical protein
VAKKKSGKFNFDKSVDAGAEGVDEKKSSKKHHKGKGKKEAGKRFARR